MRRALTFCALTWSNLTLAASPVELPTYSADLIHSDVPLWTSADQLWPVHFTDKDGWGCSSRFAFGDWQVSDPRDKSRSWLRLQNYGVFHCAYIVRRAQQREELGQAEHRYGWLIKVGNIGSGTKQRDLWVLQMGARPGSDYSLFAVDPANGTIKAADELQRHCPTGNSRGGMSIDIWSTRYCAVNSKSELTALARTMAKLPALATIRYVGSEDEAAKAKP